MGLESLLTYTIFVYFGTSFGTAASIASAVVAVGSSLISTGVSLIGKSLFGGQQPGGYPSIDAGARLVVRESTPAQRIVYGTRLVGGAMSYIGKAPPYLVTQYTVAAGRNEITGVRVNGRAAALNANGDAVDANFARNGVSLLKASIRGGAPDQAADPLLLATMPDVPATFRQRGHTSVTLRADYGADRDQFEEVWGPSGSFKPDFICRGRRIYDPRQSGQVIDDETTWTWSDNWALVMADWMRAPWGGRKKTAQIDWAWVAREADICDQPVAQKKGGMQRRYTCDATFLTSDSPRQVLNDMLTCAGAGRAIWVRGKFRPLADVPREPVLTIAQRHLAGGFTFQAENARREAPNVIRAEFIFAERDHQPATTPALVREDLIAADGERIEAVLKLPYVGDEERAQRLVKIAMARGRLGRKLRLPLWREMMVLDPGDEVRVELADFPFADGTYTVDRTARTDRLDRITVSLVESNPAVVHAWNPEEDVQDTSLITIDEAA